MDLLKIILGVYVAAWNQIFDISDNLQISMAERYEILRANLRLWANTPRLIYFSLKRNYENAIDYADAIRTIIEELLDSDGLSERSVRHLNKTASVLKNINKNLSEKIASELSAHYAGKTIALSIPPAANESD